MINLHTTFEIPDWIEQGLKAGEYIRVGGVIREAKTKKIVAMLRAITPDISQPLSFLTQVSSVVSIPNLGASILNIGISVIGFTLIIKHLKAIEHQIDNQFSQVQDNINNLHRKFDISVYANFTAALDLANDAIITLHPENRRNMATFALNRFLETQHIFNDYVMASFENDFIFINKYILLLSLTYVARSRCYLELEEIKLAISCLNEGVKVIRSYVYKYVKNLLKSQPIGKIMPNTVGDNFVILGVGTTLESLVSLQRLTRICKWLEPDLNNILDDKYILLEAQGKNLVKFVQDKTNIDKFDVEGLLMEVAPISVVSVIPIFGGIIAHNLAEAVVHKHMTQHNSKDSAKEEINTDSLLKVIENVEQIIENYDRFEAYLTELQVMQQIGMSFQNWLQLTPHTEAEMVYIIPSQPLVLN